jgi:hypothetical protein
MSRHRIEINRFYTVEEPVEIFLNNQGSNNSSHFWNNAPKTIANSIVNSYSIPAVQQRPLNITLPPVISSQKTQLLLDKWFDNWSIDQPIYNRYPKIENKYAHVENVEILEFKDFLFSRNFLTFNAHDKDKLIEALECCVINEDMIVLLEFLNKSNKLYANKKKFMKKVNDDMLYYFDHTLPSVVTYKINTEIQSYDVIDDDTDKSYMKLDYYGELGVLVKIIMNPDPDKIVPTIIVTDFNDVILEVHCYYQNKYVNNELMTALKPNILLEDFYDSDYFSPRDIEFLEMVRI